ncbi:MAG: CDP-glucose 4,6-dehydratase [Magnetococcales bacterium]|nr:CDP-glucose 4,6-dehydratase [Magnetococcales bacterium]
MVSMDGSFWRGRSVFITGHTGFKGGWLALWLHQLGGVVSGYALDPPTRPALFQVADLAAALTADTRGDVGDVGRLRAAMAKARPEVVFHLAAQPLVLEGYRDPLGTFNTNVMGTAHVLDAVRWVETVRAVVIITTDKVYENREWLHPYRENDPLGGHDPYSASKAAAEVVVASYRSSFFSGRPSDHGARVATTRAGNVIGGGDWAAHRLVPDCLRAFGAGEPVRLRFPDAVRPWQHVLEPLGGYLLLAEKLLGDRGDAFARAWNFGPDHQGNATVGEVAASVARFWGPGAVVERVSAEGGTPHEAGQLRLESSLARGLLGWQPRWSLRRSLERTVAWHLAWVRGEAMGAVCREQIAAYMAGAEPWE